MILEKTTFSFLQDGKRKILNPEIISVFEHFDPFTAPDKPDIQFPVDALPEPFGSYCKAVATSYQVDPAMPACCILAVLSSIFQRADLFVNVGGDWKEPINLYLICTAAPSERKSPTLNECQRPLLQAIDYWNEKNREQIEWNRRKIDILRKKIENASAGLAKGNSRFSEASIRAAQQELREAEDNAVRAQNWLLDDITPEALGVALQSNREAAALLSGEGGAILGNLAGRYSSGAPNLDIVLKGYSVERTASHRIGRQDFCLKRPRLTFMLMCQPYLLDEFITNDSFDGRGLCARFLFACPNSKAGTRSFDSRPVPDEIRKAYSQIIWPSFMVYGADEPEPEYREPLTLSSESHNLLKALFDEIEPTRLDMSDALQEWSGKFLGNVVRIAALLHLGTRFLTEGLGETEIDAKTMSSAIQIGRYFLTQAQYVFAKNVEPKSVLDGRYILNKLTSQPFIDEFYITEAQLMVLTRKQLFDRIRCDRFPTVEAMQEGLSELERRGYIGQTELKNADGGRPSPVIIVRPSLYRSQ